MEKRLDKMTGQELLTEATRAVHDYNEGYKDQLETAGLKRELEAIKHVVDGRLEQGKTADLGPLLKVLAKCGDRNGEDFFNELAIQLTQQPKPIKNGNKYAAALQELNKPRGPF